MRRSILVRWLPVLAAAFLLALALPSASVRADEGDKPADPAGPGAGAGGGDEVTPPDGEDIFDTPTSFTAEQVDSAIRRGVQWLKGKQRKDGSWGDLSGKPGSVTYTGEQDKPIYGFPPGLTALSLYTLLKCKVNPKDPALKNGFAYIKSAKLDDPESAYSIGMLLLAVCATADTAKSTKVSEKVKPKLSGEYRGWAQKLVDALLSKRERFKTTGWRYNLPGEETRPQPGGNEDLSATQIATLALFAAHRLGVKVPPKVWEDILKYSMAQQDEDGQPVTGKDPRTGQTTTHKARGFSYIKGHQNPSEGKPTGGMTACGLANVMMARFVLTDGGRKQEQWDARPDAGPVQASVYDGLAWLQANWDGFANPKGGPGGQYIHYWHYGLERAMDLIGLQKVGDHLWYNEIGQELINRQDSKGFWKSDSMPYLPDDVMDTCFSLLFLRRATKGNIPFPSVTGGTDDPVDNR